MNHRNEIDGLRAIAVLPVILFHAGVSAFRGGYVGVDIFFVISGFLITGIIAKDLDAGKFSIVKFYERRARRILPALFVVLLACIPFAWSLLMPADFKDFGKSLISVCVFVSNIYFWMSAGYFDAAASGKPLLHTWSLAVEEQYYLLFPLVLMALRRFGWKPAFYLIFASTLLSLFLSEWASSRMPTANFYLAPTRAWELLAGSLCAFLLLDRPQRTNEGLGLLGLAMILFSIFAYDEHTPFPSFFALVPIAGTSLIILFASEQTWAGRILCWRPFVWVGLISYSAYLWHQPLFAFTRHFLMGPIPLILGLILSVVSLALAYLSYRFVETRFRRPGSFSRVQIFTFSAIGLGVFGVAGASAVATDGGMFRFRDTPERAQFAAYFENGSPRLAYMERENIFDEWRYDCDSYDLTAFRAGAGTLTAKSSIPTSCYMPDGRKAVLIWGDSHAMALRPGLTRNLPADWQILQVASSACPPEIVLAADRSDFCGFSNYLATKTVAKAKPKVVVLAQHQGHSLERMNAMRTYLESQGVERIVFVGIAPHWYYPLPSIILRTAWVDTPRYLKTGLDLTALALDVQIKRDFMPDAHSRYVSLIDMLCNEKGCMTYLGADHRLGITTFDYGHVSLVAADTIAKRALVAAISQ